MSLYRVSLIDGNGVVGHSRTTETLRGVAAILVDLGNRTGDPALRPFLDEYGELTASLTRAGGRPLLDGEADHVLELVEELGGIVPDTDDQVGELRWSNPERQT